MIHLNDNAQERGQADMTTTIPGESLQMLIPLSVNILLINLLKKKESSNIL